MNIVLFHGSFNSYDQVREFWYPKLTDRDARVIFPRFPADAWDDVSALGENEKPKKQSVDTWLATFEIFLPEIQKLPKLVFVGHSTGPLFILHVLTRYRLKLDCAIFVCPFLSPLTHAAREVQRINQTFYSDRFDFSLLRKLCPVSYVVYGTNDPYVPTQYVREFANKMGSTVIPVIGGGHLNTEKNSGLIRELVLSRKT